MRVARVRSDGDVHLARIDADTAVLLARESAHPAADALREALASGLALIAPGEEVALADVALLAPVARPSKVLAIGLNYADHARETGAAIPPAPLIFAKAPGSIIGPGDAITWRAVDDATVDYEAELAVVIGTRCGPGDDLEGDRARAHVFGYTCCNDVSGRDSQFGDQQWVRGKSFDTFCPLGPWIVTADEIADPQALAIACDVSGERLQESSTGEMIFGVDEIVRYCARFMTLEPGDVIATGTPWGVGFARTPPRLLGDGDVVTISIEGIGELTNPCVVR